MSPNMNRRDFLKISGVTAFGVVAFSSLPDMALASGSPREFPLKQRVTETTTICCYCGVGCGAIVATYEHGVSKVEGDPDHPINEGSLCPKGQAMAQIRWVDGELNSWRRTKCLYRAPNASDWEEKSWDWMIETIAARVKATRDATDGFVATDGNGKIVNRCNRIASLGGGELDNEECYLLSKMNRALGVVYLEHCARI
jgi:formate dehydrogenase major subunit